MTKKELKKLRTKLNRMRHLVVATHWVKHTYRTIVPGPKGEDKECACLVGLTNIVCGRPWHESALYTSVFSPEKNEAVALRLRIQRAVKSSGVRKKLPKSIESFNDSSNTKREDIVLVIDTAITEIDAEIDAR